jgi:hypothetical protein
MRAFIPAAVAVVSLSAGPALADPVAIGDVVHGAALFKSYCAGCHGADGRAEGELTAHPPQRPESLRAPSVLATNTDAELIAYIVKGDPGGMPAYPHFPQLDGWDVLAFLRQGEIRITDFFANAAFFTAKGYKLDADAQKRAAQAIGRDLEESEESLPVLGFYGEAEGSRTGPQRVGDDPVELDKLMPKDKDGYLVFLDLPRGDGKGEAPYGVSLDRDGRILRIANASGTPDKAYQAFIGMGHKGSYALLKPKKVPPKIEAAFSRAFVVALVAVDMFDKEERDRHWADAN